MEHGTARRLATMTLACTLVVTGRAQRIVSINVNEASGRVPMAATDLAGAPGVRVGNWNNFRAGNVSLPGAIDAPTADVYVDSEGAALDTTMVTAITGPGGYEAANSLVNEWSCPQPRARSGEVATNELESLG